MTTNLNADVEAVQQLGAVPKILDSVSRMTGMGFVAIARMTSEQWVCCAVRDDINLGIRAGSELGIATTLCSAIRDHGNAIVINDVEADDAFRDHPTPKIYGFRSCLSVPITLSDGTIWGSLCAIDPQPRQLDRAETVSIFQLFGELI